MDTEYDILVVAEVFPARWHRFATIDEARSHAW